jgi:NCAIR mutase (PurE)-related protein
MTIDQLRHLLESIRSGQTDVEAALGQLDGSSVADLGFAQVDLDRRARCGFPEVIFCEGKTPDWVEGVARRLAEAKQDCLGTRVSAEQAEHLGKCFPRAEQDRLARTFWHPAPGERPPAKGRVLVITAGTGDLPVAQEAVVTARAVGCQVELVADVIVVAAGMDGALPSVVGGLADCPVIAVPTSVGYGAAFAGVSPLLTMLNSCAANVAVVNIDAGFKAGYVAALIARRAAVRTE